MLSSKPIFRFSEFSAHENHRSMEVIAQPLKGAVSVPLRSASMNSKKKRKRFHRIEALESRAMLSGTPLLLSDINQVQAPTQVQDLFAAGDKAYYFGEQAETGVELWATDGTPEGTRLVKDLAPGRASSAGSIVQSFGDKTFIHTYEPDMLWVTDGTEAGTVPLIESVDGYEMVQVGDLFFTEDYNHDTGHHELIVTDGTTEGTMRLVTELESNIYEMVAYEGLLYFTTVDGLWSSDGTLVNTVHLMDFEGVNIFEGLYVFDGTLHLTRNVHTSDGIQAEIWTTDGTQEGTHRLFQVPVGNPNGSFEQSGIRGLMRVQDQFFFSKFVCPFNCTSTFWTSDGTQDGTREIDSNFLAHNQIYIVDDLIYYRDRATLYVVDPADDEPTPEKISGDLRVQTGVTFHDDKMYFSAVENSGRGLYEFDIATQEATRIADNSPNAPLFFFPNVMRVDDDGTLYYLTREQSEEGEKTLFWRRDGAQVDSEFLGELVVDQGYELVGDRILSIGRVDGDRRLWAISEVGTVPLNPYTEKNLGGLDPGDCYWYCHPVFTLLGGDDDGTLWFRAEQGDGRFELWKSDGTPEGTVKAAEQVDIAHPGRPSVPMQFVVGNKLYVGQFASSGTANKLWATDLTTGENKIVLELPQLESHLDGKLSAQLLGTVNDRIIFFNRDDFGYGSIWSSDGTTEGTYEIADAKWQFGAAPVNFAGELYFSAYDDAHGDELWKTDGTVEGTSMVADIVPGGGGSNIKEIMAVGDSLYFTADDGLHGIELWVIRDEEANERPNDQPPTDPPASDFETTVLAGELELLADINPQFGSIPRAWFHYEGELYFHATNGSGGDRLWKTDGSPEGTSEITQLPAVFTTNRGFARSTSTRHATLQVGDYTYFVGRGANQGEVFVADDDDQVARILDLDAERHVALMQATATDAIFASDDGRIWVSDGTVDGTKTIANAQIAVCSGDGWGVNVTCGSNSVVVGDVVYFLAQDDDATFSIWQSDGTTAGTFAVAKPANTNAENATLAAVNGQLVVTSADSLGDEPWVYRPRIAGDTNGDNVVDFTDFLALSANFGSEDPNGHKEGDFNADNLVNFADFLLLSKHYGG